MNGGYYGRVITFGALPGCMPSKAVHASANLAFAARRAGEMGVEVGEVGVDLAAVLGRARRFSRAAREHITRSFRKSGMELFETSAKLAGREGEGFVVALGDGRRVTARRVVLDPGSRTRLPDVEGVGDADPITSETWPDRDDVGRRLAFVGGGYIGLEQGQFYARCGRHVTVIERGDPLTREDDDVRDCLLDKLREEMTVRTGENLLRVERRGGALRLVLGGGETIEADTLFVATGRTPDTKGLGLDTVGLRPGDDGVIETDDYGETAVPGLFVAGDARGGPAFTHAAHDDHHILLGRLLGERDPGGSESRKARQVPYAVFTDPELGRVGLSEKAAREKGLNVRVVGRDFARNDRARLVGKGYGMTKLVVDPESRRLHGAAIVGPSAGELVHLYAVLMHLDRPVTDLLDMLFVHPTLAEHIHETIDTLHKGK